MTALIYLAYLLLFLRFGRVGLRLLSLWQVKEYRLDRVIIHYRNTAQGNSELKNPIAIIKWILLVLNIFFTGFIPLLLFISLQIPELFALIRELFTESLRRPKHITLRTLAILFLAFLFLLSIALHINTPGSLRLYLVDRLTWSAFALGVGITSIPALLRKKIIVYLALRKRTKLANLKAIGITGSVGKTSTKEFLYQILSQKFKTVATRSHDNTDIGIARRILNDVRHNTQVFIAEMGAYKRGEIKAMCRLVQPSIGIITSVGTQHLELFGSVKNIREAKYELIANLTPPRVAVLNLDNDVTRQFVNRARADSSKILTYSITSQATVTATEIKQTRKGVTFRLKFGNGNLNSVASGLFGTHLVSNLLAASCVAWYLGMSENEISTAIGHISNPLDTLHRIDGPGGSTLFDDIYNASPESTDAAVRLLNSYPDVNQKILVLQPMIELGDTAAAAHVKVGEYLDRKLIDLLVLTNTNFKNDILKGAKPSNHKRVIFLSHPDQINTAIGPYLSPNTAIILKGKEAGRVLKSLISRP